MRITRLCRMCTMLLLVVGAGVAGAAQPLATIPHTDAPPIIDGKLGQAEWAHATAISGLVNTGATAVSEPPTIAYLMWDDSTLFVAFRCFEPQADSPRGRSRPHDGHVWEDDAVQVFIAPEDVTRAADARVAFGGYEEAYDKWYKDIRTYYEFSVNCLGATSEARNDVRDWNASWVAHTGRERGAWVVEMAIGLDVLGVSSVPQQALWGLNLLRVRPPKLSGWVNPGWGGYAPIRLGAVLLFRERPFVAQSPMGQLTPGANKTRFRITNPSDEPAQIDVTVDATGGPKVARSITVPARDSQTVATAFELTGHGSLQAAFSVGLRGESVPLLSGRLPLSIPAPCQTDVRYYSALGIVEGTIHLQPGAGATSALLTLTGPDGEAQTRADLTTTTGARLRLPVKAPPGTKLQARLQGLDAEGKTLVERKQDLVVGDRPGWLGTRAGLPLGVLPPWTPVQVSGKTVTMLGKRLEFGQLAFPKSIHAAGAELLAEPIRLTVTCHDEDVPWRFRRCRVIEQTDEYVKLQSRWRSDRLELRVTATLEYDGFCWYEVGLIPHGRCEVDRVALEIPLHSDRCRYVYPGRAQACGALSPLGLQGPMLQNLWIGDETRGLAFLAESLEWVQTPDEARQVQVLPQGDLTNWRSTLVGAPMVLDKPYKACFALHVTPAKPVSLHKSRIYHGGYYGLETTPAGGSLTIPTAKNVRLDQGSLECWVKPKFDPLETYDESLDRSAYNRMFLTLTGDTSAPGRDILVLYYNADARSMRALVIDEKGGYRAILSAPGPMLGDAWNYVALSWGKALRLNVNGKAHEMDLKGLLPGDDTKGRLELTLKDFDMDDLRVAGVPRPDDAIPAGPLPAERDTLYLHSFEDLDHPVRAGSEPTKTDASSVPGKFGAGLGAGPGTLLDRVADQGKRIVIFHEHWSRYQGYPDMEQVPKLKRLADACHERGMLLLVYFCHMMSDAAPEWPAMKDDFMVPPEQKWYHREDVKQDCYLSCVNGPFGELLLDGIAKLVDQAGIDGVYMDGTTVPWVCANPSHPGCGEYLGDGTYRAHTPIRGVRRFMKRLRSILAQRRKVFFLDAHTGGAINIATQSFCDGYYDGEHLSRYKPGFRMAPDTFLTGYMGKQFGFRGDFLPNRHTMDQALAVCLVHDTATRGQPAEVDQALAPYEGTDTRFIPYWEEPPLCPLQAPTSVLCSVYLKPNRALLVMGNQDEQRATCALDISGLLRQLPASVSAIDAITGEKLDVTGRRLRVLVGGRGWRMIELK